MYKRAISTQVWCEVVSLSSKTCMQASNMSMEVSGNVCTCMQFLCQLQPSLVTSPHVSPSEKRKWVGSGDETNYSLVSRPPPDFISQLCCFCLFFPQLWDTGSGLAMRLASCHPSCAQLYHNVSDILSPSESCITNTIHKLQYTTM